MIRSLGATFTLVILGFMATGLWAQEDSAYLAPVSNRGVLQAKIGRGSLATRCGDPRESAAPLCGSRS